MTIKDIELYKEEILELTELLRTEWLDLRDLLETAGLDTKNLFLISYYEDEEENEFGLLFTKEKKVIKFSIYKEKLNLEDITNIENTENEFPQIKVAKDF